jgi:hypothetical protein
MSKRKKHDLTRRYHRACQAALHNYCIAWQSDSDNTCVVNMVNGKVYKTMPKDLFSAITECTYKWTLYPTAACSYGDEKYTKGAVISTQSRYYVKDLTEALQESFDDLKRNVNANHKVRTGFVALPRPEGLSEAQVESILDSIGIWEDDHARAID